MNTATGNGADLGVVGGAVKVGLISGAFTGRVDFPGRAGPGILTINGLAYTIVNALGLSTTTTVTDLQGMNSGLATNYALGTDIDAAPTSAWNAGAGFVPIGTPGTPFAGRFDGLGHVITGLSVTSGAASAGLFGATGPGLSFQNVGLVGGNVLGAAGTGGLIGTNGTGSTISNSYNTGTVTGSAGTGGLVGDNTTGAITYSFTTGSVSGSAGTGGLAGTNTTGAISYSYSTSAVAGSGAGTGGLVGSNTTGAISQSYATGDVTGTGAATGGLAGSSGASLINDTYATGNVIGGGSGVGGLLGSNDGVVNTSYSAGSVSGSGSNMGSLVGQIGAGSVINSFWDTTNSVVQAGFGIGMDTSQMMSQANFTSPTPPNGNVNPNWDFANTWTMAEGVTYPLLRPFMTSLTVTANNDSKIYDGQAYSGGNGVTYSTTPNGTLLGTLSYSGTSQGAINVNNYAITPGGLYSSQQGYVITFVNGSLAINPFAVSLTGSRTYDGTVNMPAAALVIGSLTNGETLTLSGTGSVTSRNVGTLKPLTLGTLALGNGTGLASNYTFIGGTQTANITQALMTVTAQTDTKTYNGSNASAVTPLITSGALQTGDTTTTFAQNFDNANAGIGKTLVPTGGVNDGNAGANYAYTFVTTTTGVIDRKPVTLSGTTAISRPYNGNTLATLSNAGSVTTGVGAETLVVNSPLAANINFNSKDVLTANQVTGTGFTLGNGTNGGLASNYVLTSTTAAVAASITPAALTAIVAAPSKIYNGNTTAAPTLTITAGLVNTETVTATGTATFNTKDVLTANLVTVNSATLANGTNGGLASNYSLASGQTVAASITRAALIATVAAPSKVYNGNTTATPTLTITSGLVNTETVTATGTATFNTKDVLTANQVTVNSTTLANGTNGGLASNYSLGTGQTVAASITPAALTATLGASTKVYNGTTTATPILTITAGLVNAEIVTATGAGTYNTKDVLTANQVTVNSVTLANGANGGLASNYSLGAGQTAAATITPLAVSLTGTRVYNRATDFAAATLTMSSLVGSETLTLTGTGSVVDRNVGTGKSLTLGTLALGNQTGLASNYALSGGTHSASITRAPLVLSTLPVVKPYDGNVSALGTAVVTGGTLFTGDTISGGTFAYTDPNVGYGNKTVTVAAVALNDGNSGGNYQISYANSTTSTISVHPVFGPAAAVQTLSLQESLRRNALSLTPTITVSGTYIPTLIVDDFALETGNGRAVNSTMGMGRTGPALHLEETRSAPRDSENNRGGDNSTGTKSL
ncbi:MAG: YDG domain-containing protein [Candidatus Didemnitutus sp.]|nr:YDG domain-containing protein [Candidatus Didemnitutus sp.]